MTGQPLADRVVAFIGTGSELDRALVVALAEAGANLALATTAHAQAEEFAMNSIANEAWVIGREQFVTVMDALDDTAVTAFADEAWDRYGRCDALVCAHDRPSAVALDEIAPHEFRDSIEALLTAPFLAAQAFGRLMEREGHGRIVLLAYDRPDADAGVRSATSALDGLASAIDDAWRHHAVHATSLPLPADASALGEAAQLLIKAVAG